MEVYWWKKEIHVLGEPQGVDENQLPGLSRRIFRLKPIEKFQKSVAYQCYLGEETMPVWDKVYSQGRTCQPGLSEVNPKRKRNYFENFRPNAEHW